MYTVKKPINLKGRRRIIGEVVGEKDVDVSRVAALVRSGYLSEIDSGVLDVAAEAVAPLNSDFAPKGINIPILKKDGAMGLSVAPDTIANALRLMQTASAEAVAEVKGVEDEDVLIILDACDSRKTIKEAVRNRATELNLADE